MISPEIFLYRSAINVLPAHEVAGDEISVSPIREIAIVLFYVEVRSCFSAVPR